MQVIFEKFPVLRKVLKVKHLRKAVQLSIAIMLLFAAWQFYEFVTYVRSYTAFGPVPTRPPVAEGFLPLAALVAFKAWLATGTIDPVHPAGLIIFIATLLTAWLFRRALCSWICPIGTLSEFLNKLAKKIIGRTFVLPKWLDYPLLALKYVLFFYIFKMFIFDFRAEDAIQFMQIPYYAVSDIKMFDMFTNISGKWILIVLGIFAVTAVIKSFWCRYLCPYGALLGLLGIFGPIFLKRDKELCIDCNKCNKACPNVVEVATKNYVVSTECTGCASCVHACPKEGALGFKLFGVVKLNALTYSLAFLGLFFGIILWAQLTGHWDSNLTMEQYKYLDSMMSGFSAGPPAGGAPPLAP